MQREEAKRIIRQTFERPFDDAQFKVFVTNLLNRVAETPFVYRGNTIFSDFRDYIESLERIGEYQDTAKRRMDVLIVRLKHSHSLERARSTQRRFVAKYLKSMGNRDAALVAFVSPDEEDWRFSFVKMQYALDSTNGGVRVQEEFTPAKRYSFLVGTNENSHTAQTRFLPILETSDHDPTLDEIEDAFSVEKVTREFFEQYRELFLDIKDALDHLTTSDKAIEGDFRAKGVETAEFAKKLLGQIVFLYFLQKKGWFGVGRSAPWGSGPRHFLRQLFQGKHGPYENFFNDILESLFYNTLAVERTKDFADRFNCRIPFLNGGLFDPLRDYDWVNTDIALPNSLFSNSDKTPRGDVGTGVLDVFDRYNFTVKEDEPLEKEVAVDPEMLGKVFENLLEVKDRRSKGTYYTPREVVHYMCRASLVNTLSRDLPAGVERDAIDLLVEHGESAIENDLHVLEKGRETKTYSFKLPDSIRTNAELLDSRLAAIKVCDPAVGSGAFLVGMMTEIVRARQVLAQFLTESRSSTAYDFKRHAIQSSLYGVDIDPAAVEIAKLRLWLSLVVDEEGYEHIQPLPNLDYKIMQGNSLIEEFEGIQLIDEALLTKFDDGGPSRKVLKERQAEIEREYLALHKAGKLTAVRKVELEKRASQVQRQIKAFDTPLANHQAAMGIFGKSAAQTMAERLLVLHERFFAAYHRGEKERLREQIDQLTWALIETTLAQQKRVDKLEEVKQYQQISSKPFFLWKLHFAEVFRDQGGFDVVIGNPPYLNVELVSAADKKYFAKRYRTSYKRYDVFGLFFELGLLHLTSTGTVTFIVPQQVLNNLSYKKLRDLVLSNHWLQEVLYLGDKIFEAANNDVCVLLLNKAGVERIRLVNALNTPPTATTVPFDAFEPYGGVISLIDEGDGDELFKKILARDHDRLDDHCQVFQGVVTGNNEAFLPSVEQISEAHLEKPLLHPVLLGRDIDQWMIPKTSRRLLYVNGDTDLTRFPHIEKWLSRFRSELKQRRECVRGVIPWYSLQWPRDERLLKTVPKILVQRTRNPRLKVRLVAAIDEHGYFGMESLIFAVPKKDDVSLYYVLGILNSRAINFLYAKKFLNVAVKGEYLKATPIPRPGRAAEEQLAQLVQRLMKAVAINAAQEAVALEATLNSRIYSFFGLSAGEIATIEALHKPRVTTKKQSGSRKRAIVRK